MPATRSAMCPADDARDPLGHVPSYCPRGWQEGESAGFHFGGIGTFRTEPHPNSSPGRRPMLGRRPQNGDGSGQARAGFAWACSRRSTGGDESRVSAGRRDVDQPVRTGGSPMKRFMTVAALVVCCLAACGASIPSASAGTSTRRPNAGSRSAGRGPEDDQREIGWP